MKIKVGFIVFLICIIAFWTLPNYAEPTEQNLKNITRVYFCSEITKGYGSGDCILLENYDSKGNKLFGLIDTGRKISKVDDNGNNTTAVKEFLDCHGVDKLEFFLTTHIHGDHAGDALTVLDSYPINRIYVKEFDSYFSAGTKQSTYENILKKAITNNISIVGVSAESLHSESLSPSRTSSFKTYISSIGNTKDELFSSFNDSNIEFDFGSSTIKLFNWEIFAEDGTQFISGVTTGKNKEFVDNENNNSLGLLLIQGSKKAFFSGDMNNLDKNDTTGRVGDEDRIKDDIGKIDLLKLGHHGYRESNTKDYMNTLSPEYVVITNDEGEPCKEIKEWLTNNGTKYMYSTQDERGVSATITNDEVYLGCETTNSFQRIQGSMYYVPENSQYSNYTSSLYRLEYENKEVEVNSWQGLKQAIDANKTEIKRIDNTNHICYLYRLKVKLNKGGDWTATEPIEIEGQQEIILDAGNNVNNTVTIYRKNEIKDNPLISINGKLSLGTEGMSGKIIIDGGKNNNIESSSAMLKIDFGTLNLYDNVKLCNNMNKTTERTLDDVTQEYISYGSAIYAKYGTINMYGGEITNNSQEVDISIPLPISGTSEAYNYYFGVQGAGIYLSKYCEFNMYGGTISDNTAINNSKVDLISNSNINLKDKSLSQNCGGVGIFAKVNSKVNLLGGKITRNNAINNAQTLVDTTETNNIFKAINDCIYGVGIDVADCNLTIANDFEISENSAVNNSTIGPNAKNVVTSVRGGQLYANSTNLIIDGKDGIVTISNFEATKNVQILGNNNSEVNNKNYGGAIFLSKGTIYNINKMKITACKSDRGGAIYTSGCTGKINNSTIIQNTAIEYGGAIYNSNTNCDMELYDVEISNNSVTAGHGGGIYAIGGLIIDGNTVIKNNTSSKSGGGIKLGKNGTITINGGTIKENTAGTNGGGIDYSETNAKVYLNSGTIENNTASGSGNDRYPIEEILEDRNNPVLELSQIPNNFTNENIEITITVSDGESGVKLVTINDETIANKDGRYVYSIKENGEYNVIVTDYAGNTTTETFNIVNKIDKLNPKITITPDYSTECKLKEITITASDEGCSGLSNSNSYQYYLSTSRDSLEEGSWKNYTSGNTFSIGSGITGKRYLFVKSIKDNVGNTSISEGTRIKDGNETYHRFGTYIFDNEAPKASLSPNGETYNILSTESVTIKTTITVEDNESDLGVLQYAWSNSSTIEPTEWTSFNNGSEVSKSNMTSEGTWYVWTKLTDSLGNTEIKKVGNAFTIKEADIEILIKVDNLEWKNSGVKVDLYQNGVSKATTTVSNGNIASFMNVKNGTYDVYAGKHSGAKTDLIDTGLDIIINNNNSTGNVINYYSLQLVKGEGISSVNNTGYTGAKTRYYLYKNSGTQQDIAIDATVREGYNWDNWTKTSGPDLIAFDGSIKSQNIKIGAGSTVLTANAKVDKPAPVANEIEVTNTLKQTKQTATISATDGVGINKYYWGTSIPTSSSTFTDVTSTTNFSTTKEITSAGTYYFAVKDTNGTMSEIKSVVIRSYAVQNLLEKVDGTTNAYTSGNYATSGSKTIYLAKDGTSITLASVYTMPIESALGKFKGYSTTFTTSAAIVSTTAPTLNANATYYMWFNRNTYALTLNKGTGIVGVTGAGTYKYGKVVNIDATVSTGYTWEKWTKNSGNAPTNTTTKSTTVTINQATTLTACAKDVNLPTLTINELSTPTSQTYRIKITAKDEGSGLSNSNSYQYYLSSSETALSGGSWINYINGTEFTIGSGITGTRYLFVKRVKDNAENMSNANGALISINNEQYHMLGTYNFKTTINMEKVELLFDKSTFTYTGSAIEPAITLKNGNTVLKLNNDYTVSFSNNVNIGVATVNVKGKGNYFGSITRKFIINPSKVLGLESVKQDSYSITLKWNKMNGVTGYEIYKYDEAKNKYVNIKTVSRDSKKIRELSPKTSYKFKVRAFITIDDKKYYGAFSDKMKFATGTKKTKIVKINSKSKKAIIQWNKVSGAKGYKIYMATSKDGEYNWIKNIKNVKTVKYTTSKLKKNKRYYFKIRTYRIVNGKKIYSSYSEIKGIKVK